MISDACSEMGLFPYNQWERGQSGAGVGGAWRGARGVHGKLTLVGERNGERVWQPLKDSHFTQIMLVVDDCISFLRTTMLVSM